MWRLLLISHLGSILIFLSSYWCQSRGRKVPADLAPMSAINSATTTLDVVSE